MPDDNPAPQAEIAAEPAAVVEAQAPIVITLDNKSILTQDERDVLLFGPKPTVQKAPEPEPEPVVDEVAPEVETEPVIDEPPVVPEKILPNRINTAQFDPEEQEAIALRHDLASKGEKITLAQALERVAAKYAPLVDATPKATEPEPTVDPVAVLEQEVEALEKELEAFDDQVQSADTRRLNRQIAEKLSDIKAAKLEAKMEARQQERDQTQAAQKAQSELNTARSASMDRALVEYPNANDETTPLGIEAVRLLTEARADKSHPLHPKLTADNFPELLAEQALKNELLKAYEQGIPLAKAKSDLTGKPLPAQAVKAAVKAKPPEQVPVPRRILVSNPSSHTAPPAAPPPMTMQQILEKSRQDPKFRDEMLGFTPGRRAL